MKLKQSQFLNLNLYQKMEHSNNQEAQEAKEKKAKEQEVEETISNDDFNWEDDENKNGEFFGTEKIKKSKAEEIAEEEEEIEIEEEETETKENKEKKKEEPKEKLEDKTKKKEETATLTLAETLVDEGLLENVELPKKKNITTKELVDLIEKDTQIKIDKGLIELFEGLDEKGAAYLKFIKDGGKTEDFIDTFVNNAIPDIDIEDKQTHKDVILLYATTIEGLDDEDADAKYESLKEAGTTEKYAKKYYSKLKEVEKEEQSELLEKTQKKTAKEARERIAFGETLNDSLSKDEILGVPLTPKDKRVLKDVITKATHVLDGKKVTKFQHGLNKVLKSPEKLIVLAKLIEEDFNFDFIEAKAKTKIAGKVKKDLENAKEGKNLRTVTGAGGRKSLADFFPE